MPLRSPKNYCGSIFRREACAIIKSISWFSFALLVACSNQGGTPQDELRLAIPDDPRTLNPLLGSSPSDLPLSKLVFDSLLVVDEHNRLVGRLALEAPSRANGGISGDGLDYTFKLRRNIRWQDGSPLTSSDVKFTIRAILSSRNGVGNRAGYDQIADVTIRDRYTIAFHLKRRFAPFLATIGAGFPILPAHVLEKTALISGGRFDEQPVGTGPYKLISWDRGNWLLYASNQDYFLGAPKIARLKVLIIPDASNQAFAIMRHDVDFLGVQSAEYELLRNVPGIRTGTEPRNDFVAIALNMQRPILRDVRVRRALAMAIDVPRITKTSTAGTGVVAYADLPPFMWTNRAPSTPYRYDLNRARKLLDAAGWRLESKGVRSKNGVPLHLEAVNFSGSVTGRSVDAQVQQMLKTVGVDVTYQYFPWQKYFAPEASGGILAKGAYDMADDVASGGIDPQNGGLYMCAARSPQGPNIARYCSERMDVLQRSALSELDQAARLRQIAAIEKLAVNDLPYLFLYYTPKRLAWAANVTRVPSSLDDYWYGVSRWTISRP